MKFSNLIAPAMTVTLSLAACSNAPVPPSSDKSNAGTASQLQGPKSGSDSTEKISAFWTWFTEHNKELSEMNGPDAPIFPQIGERIKTIDQDLAFEIGPAPEGAKEFAVSADGNEALFPIVKKIVAAGPVIKGWKIVAFRQKTPPAILKQLRIAAQSTENGKVVEGAPAMGVAVKDMRFILTPLDGKAKVTIFIKDYKEDGPQGHMAEMIMQQAVGEYGLVKKIKEVECKPDSSPEAKDAKPFEEMGDALDKLVPDAK